MPKKEHWEEVYTTKQPSEVSWTQDFPIKSIQFIDQLEQDKNSPIIDIGGGDSNLVEHLLERGHTDLTLLDISPKAIARAQERLGSKADLVHWICEDITTFVPNRKYALWHDRACFHFLTNESHQTEYVEKACTWVTDALIIGTFSEKGPLKCSGLEICRYNASDLQEAFSPCFNMTDSVQYDHITPFDSKQNYSFGCFRRHQ
jgi:SAM-dependent methyltransferase